MSNDRRLQEQVLVAVCRDLGTGIQSVRVEQGVVTLLGAFATAAERDATAAAAASVAGVRCVSVVDEPDGIAPAWPTLASRIRAAWS